MKKRKWSLREKLLLAAPLLPLLLICIARFYSRDSLDRKIEELAGPDAVSCGVRSHHGPFDESEACMAAAVRSGRTVWVRYDQEVNTPLPRGHIYFHAQAKIFKPTDFTGRRMPSYILHYIRSYGPFGIRPGGTLGGDSCEM